jgi:mono/diheme cytochrome c family protein
MPRKAALFFSALLALGLVAAAPARAQVQTPPATPEPAKPRAPGVAPKPSADRGKVIAQRWCAECHMVSPDQKTAKADLPSFAAIATKRPPNAVPLDTFLMNPHPKMPDMQLTRTEVADLVAYIRTQKGK